MNNELLTEKTKADIEFAKWGTWLSKLLCLTLSLISILLILFLIKAAIAAL